MVMTSRIIGSIFGVISGICFTFHHAYLGILFAVFTVISFLVALLVNLKKDKRAKKNEINLEDFTFIDPPGYYTHPNYSYWICPYCLIAKNKISPVSQINDHAWYCNVCDKPLSGSKGDVFSLDDYE